MCRLLEAGPTQDRLTKSETAQEGQMQPGGQTGRHLHSSPTLPTAMPAGHALVSIAITLSRWSFMISVKTEADF